MKRFLVQFKIKINKGYVAFERVHSTDINKALALFMCLAIESGFNIADIAIMSVKEV